CGDGVNNPNTSIYQVAPSPCEVYGVDRNIRTPYVSNWNLDIQHAITNNLSIDIGYVGNHGTKLLGKLNVNQPAFGAGWTAAARQTCINSASDVDPVTHLPTPFDKCSADSNAEQAALPFTAPCAGPTGLGIAPANGSGGPFNTQNTCLSYLNYITMIQDNYESNYN